jgi:L-threonylcarbamoyladenylate synthase
MAAHRRVKLEPTTDVERAARAIARGGLVAIPTETVYGLAADATDPAAVSRIFAVKGRPASHPLIVHLAGVDDLDRWARAVPLEARRLAELSWPGPLTVIVPRSDLVPDEVTGGRDSVGLRVPAHPMTLELIRLTGSGLAAPSANRFGGVSPTTAGHVVDDLEGLLDPDLDVVLDGGACPVGVESTIVDFCNGPPQILRAGGITPEEVAELLETDLADASGPARASGMLESHYAPRSRVLLVESHAEAVAASAGFPDALVLDLSDDLAASARTLYADLRDADDQGIATIIAVMPAPIGLGHALRDRLTKAAAPRTAD